MKLCKQCRQLRCPNGDFDEGMEATIAMFKAGLEGFVAKSKGTMMGAAIGALSTDLVDYIKSRVSTRPCPTGAEITAVEAAEAMKRPS